MTVVLFEFPPSASCVASRRRVVASRRRRRRPRPSLVASSDARPHAEAGSEANRRANASSARGRRRVMSSAAASGAPPTAAIGADDANNPTTKNAATVVDVDESPPLFATASSFPGADDASLNDEEWLSRALAAAATTTATTTASSSSTNDPRRASDPAPSSSDPAPRATAAATAPSYPPRALATTTWHGDRTLLIDNHDSYTYNLYHLIAAADGVPPVVLRNDSVTWPELEPSISSRHFARVVLSPGPGTPDVAGDVGVCMDLLLHAAETPILGVCLGHQARSVHTLVTIRPRSRGERRSLRTFAVASRRPGSLAFRPDTPRRLSTPSDASELHPPRRSSLRVERPTIRRSRRRTAAPWSERRSRRTGERTRCDTTATTCGGEYRAAAADSSACGITPWSWTRGRCRSV